MDTVESVTAPAAPVQHDRIRLSGLIGAQGYQPDLDAERIAELRADPANQLWLDVVDPGPAELDLLRRQFGFHELALEDVAGRHVRPKCDLYQDGGYYFIVLYAASHDGEEFQRREIEIFWGSNYLVTVHDQPLTVCERVQQHWQRRNDPAANVPYVAYTLFDQIIDSYLPVVDWIEERVEGIEDSIFPNPTPGISHEIFRTRKQIVRMRRMLSPSRDVLNEVIRRDLPIYQDPLRPYFVDVYDHTLRALDQLDFYRDLLESALDVYLSSVSNNLNQLVKRMTALTLIVMVPSLIAGIYGMNLAGFWPSNDTPWGFAFSLGLMAVTVVGGLLAAKRADWL